MDVPPVSTGRFVEDIAPLLTQENGDLAAIAQECLGLPPLVLRVGSEACSMDRGSVLAGEESAGVVIQMDAKGLNDLLSGLRSIYGLLFGADGGQTSGDVSALLAWDNVLQALSDGRPPYLPGTMEFRSQDGSPLDLTRAFTPQNDNAEIAQFVTETGFCRLRRWIDPAVLDAVAVEVHEAARNSKPGDPNRWWATVEDGSERCVRVMYLTEASQVMAQIIKGPEYMRLGELFNDGHCIHLERPQGSEALIKPVDIVSGLSEFPWHRDCSLGDHTYHCAGYAIGLPLSATGGSAGYLRVVAGSHRVSVPSPGLIPSLRSDLPVIALDTQPGDLTIHVGCTLHGTKPPTTRREDRDLHGIFVSGPANHSVISLIGTHLLAASNEQLHPLLSIHT